MANRLGAAISPYLRSHADNPVEWFPWGSEAFTEAAARGVPVLVSIGYSTCHWCHVMARESFSDPALAAYLNANFVAIKVDREEHPDVDSTYLAAASAFISGLGWPLNVFVTPDGNAFYAGTYFPPQPMAGRPSFRQVLEAVQDAWHGNREEVESSASRVSEALASLRQVSDVAEQLPGNAELDGAVATLAQAEDSRHCGFGGAPKFPMVPVLNFLLSGGPAGDASPGGSDAQALAVRTLRMMAASPLRDAVEGGFFRYAVNADWSEPHYERMLYDNAQLLRAYTSVWQHDEGRSEWAPMVAHGVARFLIDVLQLPAGGFASAQDSESTVDGERVEGGYYALDKDARASQTPPAVDEKVLAGWNGLTVGALARAGFVFERPEWIMAARRAADYLLTEHVRDDGTLVRASIAGRTSAASATLEDFAMLAGGLLDLAAVTGEARYACAGRDLVDETVAARGESGQFGVPGGADPVLVAQGLALHSDPSEGAYPSGLSAMARAAHLAYLLTANPRYLRAARRAMRSVAQQALAQPASFGAALETMRELAADLQQLVVITAGGPDAMAGPDAAGGQVAADPDAAIRPDSENSLLDTARRWPSGMVAVASASQAAELARAGFELFASRTTVDHLATAYLCADFVCRLPVTDGASLSASYAGGVQVAVTDPRGGR